MHPGGWHPLSFWFGQGRTWFPRGLSGRNSVGLHSPEYEVDSVPFNHQPPGSAGFLAPHPSS